MKPLVYSANMPNNIEADFSIDWESLIVSGQEIEYEVEFGYLEEIKKYCNNGGIPNGICARIFEYHADAEFERLLSLLHGLPNLEKKFISVLFTKTGIKTFLKEFEENETELQKAIETSEFVYLHPFSIEGELSTYLFHYGMYTHFYQENTAEKAREISIGFMKELFDNDVDNVICFCANAPWGKWFDEHSCNDRTFVFINKKERMIYLFCFSHSD
jgi:hypothetical protein